ncbi:mechanosensitive ion channel family protein [cf. Phormidesmis sp. LEGE 11477]|uniref:mechanosensitive ion channel family protein n=1 Tax=cf. Phormidesmis sp. LEGE 11477 TaxID=1828680 RepID=UPI00187E28ED|nr:mechanosensitive ion channel family protein [cf. Phormidesmis sp. LEGE 11477]MBE9064563.1 mechanosensitive ion channel family protein [cf. Phormidesmis sp. LEGE 11477]
MALLAQVTDSLGPLANPDLRNNLIASVVGLVAVSVLRIGANRLIDQQIKDVRQRYAWRKWTGYLCYGLYTFAVVMLWLPSIAGLSTFLGLFAAGLAVVLRDPLVNLVGWLFILWRQPLQMGDRIQIGTHAGDVIDISIFQFTLMEIGNWVETDQSTGRIIHIPNSQIFQEPIANYSQGFKYIWHEIPVLITFESDWEAAKSILFIQLSQHAEHLGQSAEEHLRRAGRKYMISYSKLTPTVYTTVRESGILLTLRYLCDPRRRRGSEQVLWENILREFAKNDSISLAYPTQRFYMTSVNKEGPLLPRHVDGEMSSKD